MECKQQQAQHARWLRRSDRWAVMGMADRRRQRGRWMFFRDQQQNKGVGRKPGFKASGNVPFVLRRSEAGEGGRVAQRAGGRATQPDRVPTQRQSSLCSAQEERGGECEHLSDSRVACCDTIDQRESRTRPPNRSAPVNQRRHAQAAPDSCSKAHLANIS